MVCTSAQKVDDDKNGGDGGNYLGETETAKTISYQRVRMSVQPVFIHRGYTSQIHRSLVSAREHQDVNNIKAALAAKLKLHLDSCGCAHATSSRA